MTAAPKLDEVHQPAVLSDATRPPTVLVTELGAGAFLVQGHPTGVAAYVTAQNGTALRDVLDAAFGEAGTEIDLPPRVRPRLW